MARTPAVLHPDSEKAHHVAQGVLCALASFSVLGVLAAWWKGTPRSGDHGSPPAIQGSLSPPPAPASPPAHTLAVPVPPVSTLPAAPPPLPPATTPLFQPAPAVAPPSPVVLPPSPAPSSSATATAPPRPALPPGRLLTNPQVIEAVNAAREVRRLGDMQAALESLRSADLREPKHPEILAETALTYEAMGIASKAEAIWRELVTMGEAGAGGYFALAKSKISDSGPASPAPSASPVTLGTCKVMHDPAAKKGERITVRVPIAATPGATIEPTQMDIHVFLFESVNNGERIEQVRAATPALNWVSAPVNWKDSSEELVDVVYDLPPPKPEDARTTGRRSFHGFIVKLFYQNKLVGEQAQPESLRENAQKRSAPAGLDNALFPK